MSIRYNSFRESACQSWVVTLSLRAQSWRVSKMEIEQSLAYLSEMIYENVHHVVNRLYNFNKQNYTSKPSLPPSTSWLAFVFVFHPSSVFFFVHWDLHMFTMYYFLARIEGVLLHLCINVVTACLSNKKLSAVVWLLHAVHAYTGKTLLTQLSAYAFRL